MGTSKLDRYAGTAHIETSRGNSITTEHPAAQPRRAGRPPKIALSDIVATALDMFGTHGLHRTSIAAIAEQVGLSDAGLLHYFPSRTALLEATLAHSAELHIALLRDLTAPGGLDAIAALGGWGHIMTEAPALMAFQTLVTADAALPDSPFRDWAQRRYRAVLDLVVSLLAEGIDRGEIHPGVDAEREARDLVAWLDGLRLQWLLSGRQIDLDAAVHRHVAALVARLAVDPDRAAALTRGRSATITVRRCSPGRSAG